MENILNLTSGKSSSENPFQKNLDEDGTDFDSVAVWNTWELNLPSNSDVGGVAFPPL